MTTGKSSTSPQVRKIKVALADHGETHRLVDDVLSSRTLGRAFGEYLLQAAYIIRTKPKSEQIRLARLTGTMLDDFIATKGQP